MTDNLPPEVVTRHVIGGTADDGDHIVTKCIFHDSVLSVALDNGDIHVLDMHTGSSMVLRGHTSAVWALHYDTKRIMSGDNNEPPEIRVWNLEEAGACTHVLRGHRATIRHLELLSDQNVLVSASRDNSIRIWNLATSQCTQELAGHRDTVRCLSVDEDRQLLVSGSADHTVRVWEIKQDFRCRQVLLGHPGPVHSVAIDSRRAIIASGGAEGMLKVWDIENGTCLYTSQTLIDSTIGHIKFFGLGLAVRHSTGYISILSLEAPITLVASVAAHLPGTTCMDAVDNTIVSGGKNHRVAVWCPKDGGEPIAMSRSYQAIWGVALTGDGRVAVVASREDVALIELLAIPG